MTKTKEKVVEMKAETTKESTTEAPKQPTEAEMKQQQALMQAQEKKRMAFLRDQNKALEVEVRNLELKLDHYALTNQWEELLKNLREQMEKEKIEAAKKPEIVQKDKTLVGADGKPLVKKD